MMVEEVMLLKKGLHFLTDVYHFIEDVNFAHE